MEQDKGPPNWLTIMGWHRSPWGSPPLATLSSPSFDSHKQTSTFSCPPRDSLPLVHPWCPAVAPDPDHRPLPSATATATWPAVGDRRPSSLGPGAGAPCSRPPLPGPGGKPGDWDSYPP